MMNKFYNKLVVNYFENDSELIILKTLTYMVQTFVLSFLLGYHEKNSIVIKSSYIFEGYVLVYFTSFIIFTMTNFYYFFHKELKENNELSLIDCCIIFIASLFRSLFYSSALKIDLLFKNIIVKKIVKLLINPSFKTKTLNINKLSKINDLDNFKEHR